MRTAFFEEPLVEERPSCSESLRMKGPTPDSLDVQQSLKRFTKCGYVSVVLVFSAHFGVWEELGMPPSGDRYEFCTDLASQSW